MPEGPTRGGNSPSKPGKNKVIVEKDIGENKLPGIFKSIQKAISDPETGYGTVIKVNSTLYEECLRIDKGGITIEPKEKGGEVTIS